MLKDRSHLQYMDPESMINIYGVVMKRIREEYGMVGLQEIWTAIGSESGK